MNFNQLISEWYHLNKRDLPWRRSKDPYKIWVSEIILQQTRVDQGHDYFIRFLERFPDVAALATAGEEDVLSVWKGLGYYSRARNMHSTAKYVVEKSIGSISIRPRYLIKAQGYRQLYCCGNLINMRQ